MGKLRGKDGRGTVSKNRGCTIFAPLPIHAVLTRASRWRYLWPNFGLALARPGVGAAILLNTQGFTVIVVVSLLSTQ